MFCACGCGQITTVAPRNRPHLGHVKGQHTLFARGHGHGRFAGYVLEDRGYSTPCHVPRGYVRPDGYGRVKRAGRSVLAHVEAWEAKNGTVPDGMTLDHLCRQRDCRNPDHLEPVTHAENCRRGNATKLTAEQAREIRSSVGAAREIAPRFGIAASTVQAIRSGRLWADV